MIAIANASTFIHVSASLTVIPVIIYGVSLQFIFGSSVFSFTTTSFSARFEPLLQSLVFQKASFHWQPCG